MRLKSPGEFLISEAQGLLTRLEGLEPLSLTMPTVAAAAVSNRALQAIDKHLLRERRGLRARVRAFLKWLDFPCGHAPSPMEMQRRFTALRLRFNAALDQLDIFADVLTQRGEHGTGPWLSGLDALAEEALTVRGGLFEPPPLVTYLDRGHGAAIRRARTRLPGGALNPAAIIRIPRERMVGSGIASSLIHEVGHQGAALLGLVETLRQEIDSVRESRGEQRPAWVLWSRWISEIVADFWALSRLGVSATLGLMGVMSLPRAFVFRVNLDDPHPFPWIRARLSFEMGRALFPDPQWGGLSRIWGRLYPLDRVPASKRRLIQLLQESMPDFAHLLIHHRSRSLKGRTLGEIMPISSRQPASLRSRFKAWANSPAMMRLAPPSLIFAVLGQARSDGRIGPEQESEQLKAFLTSWALRRNRSEGAPPFPTAKTAAGDPGSSRRQRDTEKRS